MLWQLRSRRRRRKLEKQASEEAEKKTAAIDADKKKAVDGEKKPKRVSSSNSTVVRLVNCSGSNESAAAAIARLHSSGFSVISGGRGEVIDKTVVISTTNNGAVVGRLSNVPFPHKIKIARDGAADCDGVIMLGKDFK